MLLEVPNLFSAEQVANARQKLDRAQWIDGRVTAGHQSAKTKQNLQLPEDHCGGARTRDRYSQCTRSKCTLRLSGAAGARLPSTFQLLSGRPTLRHPRRQCDPSDRRHSAPHSHRSFRHALSLAARRNDGGELVVEDTYGVHQVKLPAGHMVLYPASSLHHVTPVTRGARIASFFWIQSMVRDDGERTILFDLDTTIQRLNRESADNPVAVRLTGIYHNLLRRWAEV